MKNLLVYVLPTDKEKCERFAKENPTTYTRQLSLVKEGESTPQQLRISNEDQEWVNEQKSQGEINAVVWMGHGFAGGLSGEGAVEGGGRINLDDVADLMHKADPKVVTFACCDFGKQSTVAKDGPYRAQNGPEYVSKKLAEKTVHDSQVKVVNASNTPAIFSSGMPLFANDLLDVHYLVDPVDKEKVRAVKSYEINRLLKGRNLCGLEAVERHIKRNKDDIKVGIKAVKDGCSPKSAVLDDQRKRQMLKKKRTNGKRTPVK